jgi:hypothetical protein
MIAIIAHQSEPQVQAGKQGIRTVIILYAGPQLIVNINTKTNWVVIDVGRANTDNLKKYPFLFTLIYNRYQLKAFLILSVTSPSYNTA